MAKFRKPKKGETRTDVIKEILGKKPDTNRQELADFFEIHISNVHRAARALGQGVRKTKKKKRTKITSTNVEKGDESKSRLVRYLVLRNPNADNNVLLDIWAELGTGHEINKQHLYLAKNQIKRRYGDQEIPIHHGKLNLSAMIERAMLMKPSFSDHQIVEYCESDGLDAKLSMVKNVRSKLRREGRLSEISDESPDPNQHMGPRAGAGKRRRRGAAPAEQHSGGGESYESIERELEGLIQRATAMGDQRLTETLRQSRRIASARLID